MRTRTLSLLFEYHLFEKDGVEQASEKIDLIKKLEKVNTLNLIMMDIKLANAQNQNDKSRRLFGKAYKMSQDTIALYQQQKSKCKNNNSDCFRII